MQNKKQRQIVRDAVLRSKDPADVLRELEHIEQLGKNQFV